MHANVSILCVRARVRECVCMCAAVDEASVETAAASRWRGEQSHVYGTAESGALRLHVERCVARRAAWHFSNQYFMTANSRKTSCSRLHDRRRPLRAIATPSQEFADVHLSAKQRAPAQVSRRDLHRI